MGLWNFQPEMNDTESTLGNQIEYQHWEQAELNGYSIKYIQAVETSNNTIFNESTSRDFLTANGFDMHLTKDDDSLYSGSEMFGSFGYTPSYSQIFYIPVKYFKDISITPIEGDLVYDKIDNIIFEITKVGTLNDAQQSIKTNDRMFSYKIFLKQYTFSYKDSFDTATEDVLFSEDIQVQQLDALNASLQTDIDVITPITTDEDNVFGDFR